MLNFFDEMGKYYEFFAMCLIETNYTLVQAFLR